MNADDRRPVTACAGTDPESGWQAGYAKIFMRLIMLFEAIMRNPAQMPVQAQGPANNFRMQ
ncbi:hypothetical protein [Achromobacter ruhlandii]|uniref:hypothetical protein n=1 Tax=Achromobacter ruhlandii TaxID=72557 RepID=UPI00114D1D51|nr:hypothetical protein [Achromobacter ruhlandii]